MNLSDATLIKVGNKTVSEIDCIDDLVYPFTTLNINCIWDDMDDWDGIRPFSVHLTPDITYKGWTHPFREYLFNSSNNWHISDFVPAYTYSIPSYPISGYTQSVSQTGSTFNVTFTHQRMEIDIPISLSTNDPSLTQWDIDLDVDGEIFDSDTFYFNYPNQYFYGVPKYARGMTSHTSLVPVPETDSKYRITVRGSAETGFNIDIDRFTGTLNLTIVANLNNTQYDSDIQNLHATLTCNDDGTVTHLFYNDFSVTTSGNRITMEYSDTVFQGNYTFKCLDAEHLIRDVMLMDSSITESTNDVVNNARLGLILDYDTPSDNIDLSIGAYLAGSSYPTDLEDIQVNIVKTSDNTVVKTLYYSDFTVTSQGNWRFLEYFTWLTDDEYRFVCTNASNLIRDCTLDSSSTVQDTVTVPYDEMEYANLYLIYNPS